MRELDWQNTHHIIRAGWSHWQSLTGDGPLPLRNALDPVEIPKLLENSCLVEVIGKGYDFRYLIIGSTIQMIAQAGLTGKTMREIDTQRPPSRMFDFFSRSYEGGKPEYFQVDYVGGQPGIGDVEVAVFPFSEHDPHGPVSHLWTLSVPERTMGPGSKRAPA